MLSELLKPVVDYLKGQPFNNVLIAAMLGVIVYVNIRREEQTKESHAMVHTVFQEIRAENQQNQDRLVDAMLGVRQEVKKNTAATKEIPVAAAKAAAKIVEGAADNKTDE